MYQPVWALTSAGAMSSGTSKTTSSPSACLQEKGLRLPDTGRCRQPAPLKYSQTTWSTYTSSGTRATASRLSMMYWLNWYWGPSSARSVTTGAISRARFTRAPRLRKTWSERK